MKLVPLIFFFTTIAFCNGSRILCYFPMNSRSVVLIAESLMVSLAKRGHQVTMVSPFGLGHEVPNYRDIVIPIDGGHSQLTRGLVNQKEKTNVFVHINNVVNMFLDASNYTLHHPSFQKVMENEKFDLLVISTAFTSFHQGLAAHFKCPYVLLSSTPAMMGTNEFIGQPSHPEADPSPFAGFKGPMTLWQRVLNMGAIGMEYLTVRWFDYQNAKIYRENFPSSRYPSFDEVKRNVSLILVSGHFSVSGVKPTLPNLVEVAGLQIKSKPNPLPKEIKDWIEGAEHGVMLASFGSNFKSSDLPPAKLQIFLNTFASLKQRVIWKFETDDLPQLPPNVIVMKWLPQDDILAHPNTKIFMTHFGLSSFNEALYHGVPSVGVPIAGDQPENAKKAKEEGWAEVVPLMSITQEALDNAVQPVLGDPKYKNSIQQLSLLYKDRPMTALETAIYWVEYVIRHRGAPHLHYQAADLNVLQRMSLDVWAFVFTWIWILLKGLRTIVCRRKSRQPQKAKQS